MVAGLEGPGHAGIAGDLRDVATHAEILDRARSELGGIHALAHLAAVVRRRYSVADVTEEDWDAQLDVNLRTSFFLCRSAGAAMIKGGASGRIVTFASQAAFTGGFAGSTVYAASKGGVVAMSRGLAREFGPHGITVNTVSPGLVRTQMIGTGLDAAAYAAMVAQIPLGRIAEPEEIAGVVVFLPRGTRHTSPERRSTSLVGSSCIDAVRCACRNDDSRRVLTAARR